MTWTYKLTDAGNLSVYDHKQNHVAVVEDDGSGITLPDDVCDVMLSEADIALDNGNVDRWREVCIRIAAEDIEER